MTYEEKYREEYKAGMENLIKQGKEKIQKIINMLQDVSFHIKEEYYICDDDGEKRYREYASTMVGDCHVVVTSEYGKRDYNFSFQNSENIITITTIVKYHHNGMFDGYIKNITPVKINAVYWRAGIEMLDDIIDALSKADKHYNIYY